jgi:hypothetical protein
MRGAGAKWSKGTSPSGCTAVQMKLIVKKAANFNDKFGRAAQGTENEQTTTILAEHLCHMNMEMRDNSSRL